MAYPTQQNATDQTANFFWLLILLTLGFLASWWFWKPQILNGLFLVRHYEIELIKYCVGGINAVLSWFDLRPIDDRRLVFWQHFMAVSDKKTVTFPETTALSSEVGRWLRYPIVTVLAGLAAWMLLGNRSSRFDRTHSMESLKKCEVQNWPQIAPILSLNLLKADLNEGPWAMAQLPLDFCKQHGLLEITWSENNKKIWILKTGLAERLFALQTGPLWHGIDALPIHAKALLVIFAARGHRDHAVSEDLLLQISESALHGQLDFNGVEALASRYKDSKLIQWLERRHAYVGALMASLLEMVRREGVLASAEFLWLKPLDRRLWYMLNSVGRRTAVVEVAGLFAHWLAEKQLQRPLRVAMVKEAVSALDKEIKEVLYISEEEKWYTSRAA